MIVQNIIPNIPKTEIFTTISTNKKVKICDAHYHDEMEFLVIYEGEIRCTADGKDYTAKGGDIVFIASGTPHETTSLSDPLISALIQFRESDFLNNEIRKIVKYSQRFAELGSESIRVLNSPGLFATLDDIIKESQQKDSAYEIMIRSSVYKTLGILYREGILSDGEQMYKTDSVQKILPALTYINEKYNENITLSDASSLLGFEESYFCRIFKSAVGATFTEYLNFVRICKAEKMLARSRDSILDISAAVGFSSVSYFNRIFKRYKNCSPRYYRTAKYCKNM
jgi:AraC-like DNA-binding protein/quercetin dioxygenase-like cupin family protein